MVHNQVPNRSTGLFCARCSQRTTDIVSSVCAVRQPGGHALQSRCWCLRAQARSFASRPFERFALSQANLVASSAHKRPPDDLGARPSLTGAHSRVSAMRHPELTGKDIGLRLRKVFATNKKGRSRNCPRRRDALPRQRERKQPSRGSRHRQSLRNAPAAGLDSRPLLCYHGFLFAQTQRTTARAIRLPLFCFTPQRSRRR